MIWISNHAVVRYIERVAGIDLCGVRAVAMRECGRHYDDADVLRIIARETGLEADAVRGLFPLAKLEQARQCCACSMMHEGVHYILSATAVVTLTRGRVRRKSSVQGNYGGRRAMALMGEM